MEGTNQLTWQGLIATGIGAAILLIILPQIGFSMPVGNAGTRFHDLAANKGQSILAQASLFTGSVGFSVQRVLNTGPKSRRLN